MLDPLIHWFGQAPALGIEFASFLDAQLPRRLLGQLLLPPALPLLVTALGLLLLGRARRAGRVLAWFGLVATVLTTSSLGASQLAWWAEGGQGSAPTADQLREALLQPDAPQAIVILGGGTRGDARERPYREFPKTNTLERLVHGAWVARVTRLPVLVTGGPPRQGMASEATIMQRVLEQSLATPVRWVEDRARTTAENASYSARILHKAGVTHIVLVTQAMHMPRAQHAFERAGLTVLAAPMGFAGAPHDWSFDSLIPSGTAAALAYVACHEMLGSLWYRIVGG